MVGNTKSESISPSQNGEESELVGALKEIQRLSAKLQSNDRQSSLILSLRNAISSVRNKMDLYNAIENHLKKLFDYDDFVICLINDDRLTHSAFIYNKKDDFEQTEGFVPTEADKFDLNDRICKTMIDSDHPVVIDIEEALQWENAPAYLGFWHTRGIQEMIGIKMVDSSGCIGFLCLYTLHKNSLANTYFNLLYGLALQISVAVSNIKANEKIEQQLLEIQRYRDKLEEEKTYLREEISNKFNYYELVGQSKPLKDVFYLIDQVASSDSTVLILGETGTGKELIARAIHGASPRKNELMIKINCAALPSSLAESELFGHEKGSFTGATERRIGKFELAHNSTLFLDEVGELSPEIQVKLLRALQEKEIERVGGKQVIKTDVRVLAATNRNLLKEVEKGNFRSDLFYRLNVFPITVPPLRDRIEDIPSLASHFIDKISKKTGKIVNAISKNALNKLSAYPWPGNIRELEHLVERSVLLAQGSILKEIHLPKVGSAEVSAVNGEQKIKTIHENERDHILDTLSKCKGKISGTGGAAEILGIPPTTLNSKIKKFGIKREHILNR